jgi:hypothetical protein
MLTLLIQKDTTLSNLCTCRDFLPDYEEAEKQQMWEQEYESVRAYTWGEYNRYSNVIQNPYL